MKRLTWFLVRRQRLPAWSPLRRWMLRSIFHPADLRDQGLSGWYSLPAMTPEQFEHFRLWVWNAGNWDTED